MKNQELMREVERLKAELARAMESRQQAQRQLEDVIERSNRVGLDVDRAMRGEVNHKSPIASRMKVLASFALAHKEAIKPVYENDGMYYLQDTRQSVGNCPLWWRKGGSYTSSLAEAEIFTLDAAVAQMRCRDTDLPWSCFEVDLLRRPTVDAQYLPRGRDEQRDEINRIKSGLKNGE